MKAIRVHTYGGPEVLRFDDVERPEPAPGFALVRVRAAGVNFIDVYQRTGRYSGSLPFTLGMEGAGVVEAVGEGVYDLRPGDRVGWASYQGSYAEFATIPAARLIPIPDAVSDEIAAAVLLQGMTAHYLARSTYPLHEGDVAVVHAAAGGVGLLLTQIAKRLGARVIGTVST
ncbi:MAG: alcohol dehydrogenase catalytic domain-containing protein, partial [Thermoanaerobaculia bacterium]